MNMGGIRLVLLSRMDHMMGLVSDDEQVSSIVLPSRMVPRGPVMEGERARQGLRINKIT